MLRWTSVGVLACLLGVASFACGEETPHDGGEPDPEVTILHFAVTPRADADEVVVAWEVVHATRTTLVLASGDSELSWEIPAQGSQTLAVGVPQTISLVAEGPGGPKRAGPAAIGEEPPPPLLQILSFSAIPAEITRGEASTLRWRTRNADEVRIVDEAGQALELLGQDEEGEVEVRPEASTTYRLVARAGDQSLEREASVFVGARAVRIVHFGTDQKGPVAPGAPVTLTWEVEGADEVEVDNLEGATHVARGEDASEGSGTLPMGAEGRFSLRATGGARTEVEELRFPVLQPPSITAFWADPPAASTPGGAAHLRWSGVLRAEELELHVEPAQGGEPPTTIALEPEQEGSRIVPVAEDTRFVLVARNGAGEAERSTFVEVVPLPRILSFEASTTTPASGETITLSWETADATTVRLEADGSPHDAVKDWMTEATVEATVTEPTEFVLRAYNRAGDGVEQAITVVPR